MRTTCRLGFCPVYTFNGVNSYFLSGLKLTEVAIPLTCSGLAFTYDRLTNELADLIEGSRNRIKGIIIDKEA
jgi:hypothetical protein